jgi:hypothetical protein
VLVIQILHFSVTDSVLAGTGSAHGKSALHGLLRKSVRFLKLRRVVGIENAQDMKVAIAHMADNRQRKRNFSKIILGFGNAFRQTRNAPARVATDTIA